MENVTKSIIYGNIYENRYGKFLPVCASINDRGPPSLIQLPFNPSLTTSMKPLTLRNTTAQPTPFGSKKRLWSSSPRRKMWSISSMMAVTVIRPSKVRERNFCICSRNSVKFRLSRCKECVHIDIDTTVQPALSILDYQLQGDRRELSPSVG